VLFPKLFAGEFGAEISALLDLELQVIHSSFFDGDLEAFIYSRAPGLPQRIPLVLTTVRPLCTGGQQASLTGRSSARAARIPHGARQRA